MKDLLNGYEQYPPLLIEIEITEGCNLGCSFCGLRGIRKKGTKPWKFMSVEDAKKIAIKIKKEKWNSKIVFAGHGEPTLNPNLLEIIKIFRKELPINDISLMTNGAGFTRGIFEIKNFCKELKEIRFNDLVFDIYSDNGDWNEVLKVKNDHKIIMFGEEKKGDECFTNKMPYNKTSKNHFRIILYPLVLLNDTNKSYRKMQNHCGAAAPLDYEKENTTCTKVFRELFIRWDGNVSLCCDDFRGQYFIANILSNLSIKEVWNHERFQAARIRLFNKDRKFLPCHGCNCPPNKAGFIPDITGGRDKNKIPIEISEEVRLITEEAYLKNGLTTIIKRKWE